MSRSNQWSGKGKRSVAPWRIQAGKAKTLARTSSFSMGGLPRKRDQSKAISLPKLKFQDLE